MASISGQLEELYMGCSRKDMNDTLTEVLLAACVTPALMPDRLLMEHVLLVSILHHAVGLEVSATLIIPIILQPKYQVITFFCASSAGGGPFPGDGRAEIRRGVQKPN